MTAENPSQENQGPPAKPPVVWIDGAVLADAARRAHPAVSLALWAGLQAVVGAPADGMLDIAPLVSGITPRRSGVVKVCGRDPVRDPALRGRIGATFADPRLPPVARVRDIFDFIPRRDGTGPEDSLARFGLGHWAGRRASSLSRCEMRALELVVALSIPSPFAVMLTEPTVDMADVDREAVKTALAGAAEAGACVVVLSSSVSDAIEIAPRLHMIENGRLVRSVPSDETGALLPGRGITLRVDADLPRVLAAQLADDPAVIGIDWDQASEHSLLSVRGNDLDLLAAAVARAVISSGAKVRSITPVAPGLDEVRAATAGLANAAYQAAYYKAWAQAGWGPPREGQT